MSTAELFSFTKNSITAC